MVALPNTEGPAASDRGRRFTRGTLTVVVGAAFLWAAAVKALWPNSFAGVIAWLTGDPTYWWALIGAFVVTGVEALVGASLLAQGPRVGNLIVSSAILLAFSAVLVLLVTDPNAPGCGCFTKAGAGGQQEAAFGLLRNVGLLAMLGWLAFDSTRGRRGASADGSKRHTPSPAGRGFTLIEMIVVVFITGVLLAIVLPALGHARQYAHDTRRTSTCRQLGIAVASYADDHRDHFPYPCVPGYPGAKAVVKGYASPFAYFGTSKRLWASLIWPDYYAGPRTEIEDAETRRRHQEQYAITDDIVVSSFGITNTIAAAPPYWVDDEAGQPVDLSFSHLKGMTLSQVAFPSDKAILLYSGVIFGFGWAGSDERGFTWVAWADSSAQMAKYAPPWTDFPLRFSVDYPRPFDGQAAPVMTTFDGIHGRDR